ncbi:MAG: polysaccharide biosynthesis protein, partial [Alphaproteobacteria bacterium]|nr:polysaccharide biosynthesis protein [Alphaproteobacteria bacterium]
SAALINGVLLILMLAAPRIGYRLFKDRSFAWVLRREERRVPVLLVGAGDRAEMFLREMARSPVASYRVVGIVDDKPGRIGRAIRGVRVLGSIAEVEAVVERLGAHGRRPQRLIIASEKADGPRIRELLAVADRLGMTLARLPDLAALAREGMAPGTAAGRRIELRPIDVEDLLGRPQKVLDRAAMRALISGRRVLVTGAGGTIGAELVRQIAALGPARLVLLDNGEHHLYLIDRALGESHPDLARRAVLADVREPARIAQVFLGERPELVFHAAAFKHVPLSEANAEEAVLTNVLGTRHVAEACRNHGAAVMVLISTDKAVNPASVMGASKRVAEMICQALDGTGASGPRYVTVRFGNVLGSTGSVVPLFEHQLAQGGPLTVTHHDMTRYFMTTKEAVELVLQASSLSLAEATGKVFVLDMGEPVRIDDLARQMIRLAGLRPERDVPIVYTGLRPGEKLSEELLHAAERLAPTPQASILLAAPRTIDYALLCREIDRLAAAAAAGRRAETLALLARLVPEYRAEMPAARRAASD